MQAKKMEVANPGIRCAVDTCHYYMCGDHCCAEQIQVGPKGALGSGDTDCTTFVPHQL